MGGAEAAPPAPEPTNCNGVTYAFLPCVMSTSGRMHGQFLRLLFIIAHRRTVRWFKDMGDALAQVQASKS